MEVTLRKLAPVKGARCSLGIEALQLQSHFDLAAAALMAASRA